MDEEIENLAELSEKSWSRVVNSATKAGYREGIEEGKRSVFQTGFDIGYEEAFETAFVLGKYKGIATAMTGSEHQGSPLVDNILEKTRRGACQICANKLVKSKNKVDDNAEPSLENLKNKQRIRSTEVLRTLHEHFDALLKERGVCVDRITLRRC